jgi:hypothetical protein
MRFVTALLACLALSTALQASGMQKTETVILITMDGLRWQELYRGVDSAFFDQEAYTAHKKTNDAFKAHYWRASAGARRRRPMPFFWGTVAREGQLYGNRDAGSRASVTNRHHFSYPGYSEILTGIADDARLASNDKIPNPNVTVLEWLNAMPENRGRVAAFGSWDVFPYIINEARSGVPVNAGFEPYAPEGGTEGGTGGRTEGSAKGEAPDDAEVARLNHLQALVPSPWDTVRLDAFTMGYARAALAAQKMRFVYISLGETDDFAHDGHYDQYIKAATRSDRMIGELWAWLQSDARYAGKTTLLFTTDHGRGSNSRESWRHHGRFPYKKEDGTDALSDFPGDGQVWMAALGPDTPARGMVAGGPELYSNQIAATAARLLGYRYQSSHPVLEAGAPIGAMLGED